MNKKKPICALVLDDDKFMFESASHLLRELGVDVSMENPGRFNLPDIDEAAVQDCNMPIDRVTLEITKGKLAKVFAQTLDILIRIRLKGFGVEYRGGH